MVPFIDFPDLDIMKAFYYRWRMYRNHIKWTLDGFVVTEFLPYVPWSGRHNTIPAAAGHQILEGRWLHDLRVLDDTTAFWTNGRGDPTTYTNWIGYAALHRYYLTGNSTQIASLLKGLVHIYRESYVPKYLRHRNGSKATAAGTDVCWFQNDGSDAMEVSISGSGCRPTMASAMWAEAMAIAEIARLAGGPEGKAIEEEFSAWRDFSAKVVKEHWNPRIQLFSVIPLENSGERSEADKACDLSSVRIANRTVDVRELLGFVPWYFEGLLHEEGSEYLPAWEHLFDAEGFAAKFGLRTAERRHACYNYSFEHGDFWNGPSWPYETSRLLTAAANVLRGSASDIRHMTRDRYYELLLQYARQHTLTTAVNDTAQPAGSGHIFENLHPDLGYWNNRARMYWKASPQRNMGDNYDHSSFCDLVISGLLGLHPQQNNSLVVDPLVPANVQHFALDHVRYRGHYISIVWDADGKKYRRGRGLHVLVDGQVAAFSPTIAKLVVPVHVDDTGLRELLYV